MDELRKTLSEEELKIYDYKSKVKIGSMTPEELSKHRGVKNQTIRIRRNISSQYSRNQKNKHVRELEAKVNELNKENKKLNEEVYKQEKKRTRLKNELEDFQKEIKYS